MTGANARRTVNVGRATDSGGWLEFERSTGASGDDFTGRNAPLYLVNPTRTTYLPRQILDQVWYRQDWSSTDYSKRAGYYSLLSRIPYSL